jgi:hypothetical protein
MGYDDGYFEDLTGDKSIYVTERYVRIWTGDRLDPLLLIEGPVVAERVYVKSEDLIMPSCSKLCSDAAVAEMFVFSWICFFLPRTLVSVSVLIYFSSFLQQKFWYPAIRMLCPKWPNDISFVEEFGVCFFLVASRSIYIQQWLGSLWDIYYLADHTDQGFQGEHILPESYPICSDHEECIARPERIKIQKGFVAKESVKGHMASSNFTPLGNLSVQD